MRLLLQVLIHFAQSSAGYFWQQRLPSIEYFIAFSPFYRFPLVDLSAPLFPVEWLPKIGARQPSGLNY